MESFQSVNLKSLRDALPAIPFRAAAEAAAAAATPVARNANVLLNSITTGALKMNTYEFIQHISSDGQYYDDPDAGPEILKLLDSKYDAERAQALKRILALVASGVDASQYYPHVVKLVISPSLPVKRMVSSFVSHYASLRPQESLMVINTLHKDLSHPDPSLRAHAMRAIAGIRVNTALPIALLAARRTSRDPSPLVRSTTALSLAAVAEAGGSDVWEEVIEFLDVLLKDSQPLVIGAAACALLSASSSPSFQQTASTASVSLATVDSSSSSSGSGGGRSAGADTSGARSAGVLPLPSVLSSRFRFFCQLLPDLDQWGQAAMLQLLMREAALRFPTVGRGGTLQAGRGIGSVDSSNSNGGGAGASASTDNAGSARLPSDLQLLLRTSIPLLSSSSAAVTVTAATVMWEFQPSDDVIADVVAPALVFLLRSQPQSQLVTLTAISSLLHYRPAMFLPHLPSFFVSTFDSPQVRSLKLLLLPLLATPSTVDAVLYELQCYLRSASPSLAVEVIQATAQVGRRVPSVAARVVEGLVDLVVWRGGGTAAGGAPSAGDTTVAANAHDAAGAAAGGAVTEAASSGGKAKVQQDRVGGLQAERQGGTTDGSWQAGSQCGEYSADSCSGNAARSEVGGRWVEVGGSEEGRGEDEEEDENVVTHALASVKVLAGQNKQALLKALSRLLPITPSLPSPSSRALVLSLLSKAATTLPSLLPTAIRSLQLLTPLLLHDGRAVKLQLLNTVATVFLLLHARVREEGLTEGEDGTRDPEASKGRPSAHLLSEAQALLLHLLDVYAKDLAIDIIDRCRIFQCILHPILHSTTLHDPVLSDGPADADSGATRGGADSMQCAEKLAWQLVLGRSSASVALAGEGVSWEDDAFGSKGVTRRSEEEGEAWTSADSLDRSRFLLYSLSHFVNHVAPGYAGLPNPIPPAVPAERSDVGLEEGGGVASTGEGTAGAVSRGESGAGTGQEKGKAPVVAHQDSYPGELGQSTLKEAEVDDEHSGRIAALNAWLDDE